MEAPDAEVLDPHAGGQGSFAQTLGHFDAEAVVGLEDVADASHQNAPAHRDWSWSTSGCTSSGWKNK